MATDNCITIPLTRGYSTVIDLEDADLAELKWHSHTVRGGRVYAKRDKQTTMHRIILGRILGRDLIKGEICDHVDNNSLNNQRDNLRLATKTQNQCNSKMHKNNSTGFKGVSKHRNCYHARIQIKGHDIYLGRFDTPEEAHAAYCGASTKYHGEFGRTE